ncbi:aldo/keto reductase, partial [Alphaproteobacteria bacterium]|nr:aldo/keto reductase [Alphaproteobacteria bacterium]
MTNLKKKIIIGTWSLTDTFGKINKKNIEEVINYSIQNDFKEFDTAPNYGSGQIEKILSEFKKKSLFKLKINTKFGNSRDNIKSFKKKDIIKSLDKSIELFNNINTIYIHNPRCSPKQIEKIIDIILEYKEKKYIKNIGISIARDFYFEKSILDKFDFIQDEVNVLFYKNLNYLKKTKARIIARSPLASGCLSG